MPSSTSSSSAGERLPTGGWLPAWALALALAAAAIAAGESYVRARGYLPSVSDSVELWLNERARLDVTGVVRPIAVLGASRIQLGLDIATLRRLTGRSAVQLAIDGTSFLPILEDLADAGSFAGTVLVSMKEPLVEDAEREITARHWTAAYRARVRRQHLNPFPAWEASLSRWLSGTLALRTESAPAYVILLNEWVNPGTFRPYLTTRLNRERLADYRLLAPQQAYVSRVMRHFGAPLLAQPADYQTFLRTYEPAVARLTTTDSSRFMAAVQRSVRAARVIEARGGRVIFLRMPSDKLVWEIDRRRHPRARFWQQLAERHPHTLHFQDYPELNRFELPDGSHLDRRDREPFTRALAERVEREFGW